MNDATYVVVTGASSGIGYETAKAFAARGFNVVVAARRTDRLEKLRAEIAVAHPDVDVVVREVNLANEQDTIDFYESLRGLSLTAWVNNAGRGNKGDITNTEFPDSLDMMRTNVNAVAILSALFVRDHKDQQGAQLINVSSIGGYLLVPGATLYCATKFFDQTVGEMDFETGRIRLSDPKYPFLGPMNPPGE